MNSKKRNENRSSHPDELIAKYDALLVNLKGIERKGAAMPYTSFNGHMFSFINKEGLMGLRLPDGEREAFLKKFKTTLCVEHGTVLKEYVLVPEKLFANTKELEPYLLSSFEFVKSLKPKPTKK
ncbi:MAG: hypothetical protein ACKVOR_11125 [Flavobacteriales bacterium]